MYNIDTQEQVAIHMYGFDGSAKYFRGEPIGRSEVEVSEGSSRMERLQERRRSLNK